jgi:hypothetical protein
VNYPSINGEDAVRQSALRPATAGPHRCGQLVGHWLSGYGRPKGLGDRAIALRQPRVDHEAACLYHDHPISPPPYSFSNAAALRNQPAPARALVITDEASPFALRLTRNSFRGQQCTDGACVGRCCGAARRLGLVSTTAISVIREPRGAASTGLRTRPWPTSRPSGSVGAQGGGSGYRVQIFLYRQLPRMGGPGGCWINYAQWFFGKSLACSDGRGVQRAIGAGGRDRV